MSARRVPSGIRPSRSHSRRPISEPPRRPATAIRTPLAPAFIELGLPDLLDLELDLALAEGTDLLAQDLDVLAALADDDARLGGMDRDGDVIDPALDLDLADARVGEAPLDELADGDVLLEERGVVLVRVP